MCVLYVNFVYVFVGIGNEDNIDHLLYVWYYFIVKSNFKHASLTCLGA